MANGDMYMDANGGCHCGNMWLGHYLLPVNPSYIEIKRSIPNIPKVPDLPKIENRKPCKPCR